MKVIRIYSLAWVGLVILAILNGTLRVEGYGPFMSELMAHQLSTAIALLLFTLYFWILARYYPLLSSKQAWTIGILWLAMTILFEFLFGHYVVGHPWSKLMADYNIFSGRLWILVLIWTTIGPWVFFRFRSKSQ